MTLIEELHAILGLAPGVVLTDGEMDEAVSMAPEQDRERLTAALATYREGQAEVREGANYGPFGGFR